MTSRKINGCPLEIQDLDPQEISDVLELYKGAVSEYIRVGPKGYFVPKNFKNILSDIYNMPLRPKDIFVATYQRSGTTWTQELVWLVANDLDYETAASLTILQRYPFLDIPMFFNDKAKENFAKVLGGSVEAQEILKAMTTLPTEILATASDPRFVKTHLPFSLLPPSLLDTTKVVYVARDPRDVIVSSYHHTRLFQLLGYEGDFKQFWNLFIKDKFTLTPYFEHVKEAWALRHYPNMLFLFYEELLQDLPSAIRRVCKFLGKELTTDQIAGLCDHLSIENFKNNKSVNFEDMQMFGVLAKDEKFIRKGKAGGWREYFDSDMTQQMEKWVIDNLRDSDLRFPSMTDAGGWREYFDSDMTQQMEKWVIDNLRDSDLRFPSMTDVNIN